MSNLRIGSVSTTSPRLVVQVTPRSDIVLADVTLNIRRLGDPSDYATYGVLQAINNVLIFQFDALLFDMPYGRYAGTLVFNGTPYASFEFNFTADVSISPALQVSTTGPYKRPDDYATPNWSGTGVAGPGTFIGLKDVEHSYAGCAGFVCFVNGSETGIQFLPAATLGQTSWGDINGDITAQSDLQGALSGLQAQINTADAEIALKANSASLGTAAAHAATDFATAAQGAEADTALQGVTAGTNVTIDNTDPKHPVINATGGGSSGVAAVVAGSGIAVDNTDPTHPVVSAAGGGGGGNVGILNGAYSIFDATYTLQLSDIGNDLQFNNSGPVTVTIPPQTAVAWPLGSMIMITQLGAGAVTVVVGSGVFPLSAPFGAATTAVNDGRVLENSNTNVWKVW